MDRNDDTNDTVQETPKRLWGMPPFLKEIIDWVLVLAIAVGVTYVIRSFVFTMVVVEGPSMQHTLCLLYTSRCV